MGRIRLRQIADVSAGSLLPFVREAVVPGAHVHTDGWKGYAGLGQAGFKHRVSVITASADPAHVVMPRVHRVAALLKRWLLGTHQGGVKAHQLDASAGAGRKRGGYCSIGSRSRPWRSPGALPRHHWETRKSGVPERTGQ